MNHFDFGKNWQAYSKNALNATKLDASKADLERLVGLDKIKGKTFLDIGSGSGIHAIAAKTLGAEKVIGFDISAESIQAAQGNANRFNNQGNITFYRHSILSDAYKKFGTFDIVYSWGVLHHTGDMWRAIHNSMDLVNKNGLFVIAIYNKHWSSPAWRFIKYIYNVVPKLIKKVMIFFFYWIILVAKFLVTFKNPFRKKRGMNFYYDVIDWVGGYPYEYASKTEVENFFNINNFTLIKYLKPQVPTGCGEFVFQKQ